MNQDLPRTRKEALRLGSSRYFTGMPCKWGHVCPRHTASWNCDECHRRNDHASYTKSADSKRARQRRYWHATPAARVASRARQRANKQWRATESEKRRTDPEYRRKILDGKRADKIKNRERYAKRMAAWQRANPEAIRGYTHKRRAQKIAAEGHFTGDDIRRLLAIQQGVCAECIADLSAGYQVDHIHPLSRGGSNWPDNLQLLCKPCNQSKGAKTVEEWRARRWCLAA